MVEFRTWGSPLGRLWLGATAKGLVALRFVDLFEEDGHHRRHDLHPLLLETVHQLEAYFQGDLRHFDLPLDLRGTPFQMRVWEEVARIPYGETRTYGYIAEQMGHPWAARAVGQALRHNPIVIVIPCHRVIAADGRLGGYAAGLWRKRALLMLEGALTAPEG